MQKFALQKFAQYAYRLHTDPCNALLQALGP
jgi:hypothetical protein